MAAWHPGYENILYPNLSLNSTLFVALHLAVHVRYLYGRSAYPLRPHLKNAIKLVQTFPSANETLSIHYGDGGSSEDYFPSEVAI